MQKRLNVHRFKTRRFFYQSFHVLLQLLNAMRKFDNIYGYHLSLTHGILFNSF